MLLINSLKYNIHTKITLVLRSLVIFVPILTNVLRQKFISVSFIPICKDEHSSKTSAAWR
nr:hypothetical protein [Mucilaginibacter sp. X4EP1]